MTLYADGEPTDKTLTLNANNNWKGIFTELDKYKNGKEINYTVVEAGVSGVDASKYITTITLGKKVKVISKGAFKKYKKTKVLVVKTKKLKKSTIKKSLKGSKITKIKVKVGKKKDNRKYAKKYKKIFKKKIVGKKVKVTI